MKYKIFIIKFICPFFFFVMILPLLYACYKMENIIQKNADSIYSIHSVKTTEKLNFVKFYIFSTDQFSHPTSYLFKNYSIVKNLNENKRGLLLSSHKDKIESNSNIEIEVIRSKNDNIFVTKTAFVESLKHSRSGLVRILRADFFWKYFPGFALTALAQILFFHTVFFIKLRKKSTPS